MDSLADLQRTPGSPPAEGPPTLPIAVERVRTFDTPEFAGMMFLEVESKTALNKVTGMPFGWSINPYRGCSHACSYCLGGDTPVLMADGRTTPLAELRRGDAIYGTVSRGGDRRYTVTRVRDHWSTVKPAYRVRLEDGTALVTSGDHRFLSDRGWAHVTGSAQGPAGRHHLTPDTTLVGTGQFAAPPKGTADYRQGYLCGILRGGGHVGGHSSPRRGRSPGRGDGFLTLVDPEALVRSRRYLASWGITTTVLDVSAATSPRTAVKAIRTPGREAAAAIRRLTEWPAAPSECWAKGFLAGIWDADGGRRRDELHTCPVDEGVLSRMIRALRRLGFEFTVGRAPNGCPSVRLRGGVRERLRFFHTTDPAITHTATMDGLVLTSDASLRVVAVEPLGVDLELYDITTGTGDFIADGVVSHNCFARPTHRYLNLSPLGDFERTVVVKTNVVGVLRRELAKPSWRGDHVAMGTNTDPYQRCEGRYRLMPGIIAALADGLTPFSILTKGTLITRDLDVLRSAGERVPVSAALTVGMLDEDLWRTAEPGTPPPEARLAAVRRLNDAGVATGVMLAPIMPGLNDDREQLAALVDAAAAAGATSITPIVLHLRPGVREVFWPWLEAAHPELVDRYAALYTKATAPKSYREPVESFVAAQRRAAYDRHGWPSRPPQRRADSAREPPPASPTQLRLL